MGGTPLRFTPLYGTGGGAALSGLLEIGDFVVLLDCGWDHRYDPALLRPLHDVLDHVDAGGCWAGRLFGGRVSRSLQCSLLLVRADLFSTPLSKRFSKHARPAPLAQCCCRTPTRRTWGRCPSWWAAWGWARPSTARGRCTRWGRCSCTTSSSAARWVESLIMMTICHPVLLLLLGLHDCCFLRNQQVSRCAHASSAASMLLSPLFRSHFVSHFVAQATSDFDAFNLDDVDAAFSPERFTTLRYQQNVTLTGGRLGVREG